jgi:uncharacterized YccA/Bax inhibitor family protein
MDLFRSSNPAFSEKIFSKERVFTSDETMTVQGTMNKALLMLVLVVLGAAFTWKAFFESIPVDPLHPSVPTSVIIWMAVGGIGGFITSLVVIFAPKSSPIAAPIYAVLEGLFLGGISAIFAAQYTGNIIIQAVGLTFLTFFLMLTAYRSGWIKVTEKFKTIIIMATAAIALMYFITFILGFFGINVGFINSSSPISIGISVVIIAIAALNLLLDFDFIDKASAQGAPKYMEWFGAFGLMVTLIWLYIEFLRLLSKLNSRN